MNYVNGWVHPGWMTECANGGFNKDGMGVTRVYRWEYGCCLFLTDHFIEAESFGVERTGRIHHIPP